jgi:type IV pilus assembly protein PilM
MARSLIGLDVGTNAVTVAEVAPGDPPRLVAFGQVALTREAMRDGEVVDPASVADAIRRLRGEVGIRRGGVRVGLASPRLVVRQVEMPVMSRDDLAGALRFQAADLIPFNLDEAVLDFAILDQYQPPGAEPVMRVLLAAAQATLVDNLVRAVESAGLAVDAVDLIPLALIRSLGTRIGFAGAEGIVSLGGGTTCVVVHEAGVPRFVRVLGSGGRQLTEAISGALDLTSDAAESIKRQIGVNDDPVVAQAREAIDRPLGVLLDEVRSSIDYYRNQPGAAPLAQILLTGGTAQLAGVTDRLSALLGVPARLAAPRERLVVGDIGFGPDELPRLDPYLPAAVGLALVDAGLGPSMNLLPTGRRVVVSSGRTKYVLAGVGAAAALAALLAVPTVSRRGQVDDAKDETARLEQAGVQREQAIADLADVAATEQQIGALQAQIDTTLAGDVSWTRLLREIAIAMPNDVWLTSFSGQVNTVTGGAPGGTVTTTPGTTAPGTVVGGTAGAIDGSITVQGVGLEFPSIAAWIEGLSEVPALEGLWVPNATKSTFGDEDVVDFTSSAGLTDDARSDRAERRREGP